MKKHLPLAVAALTLAVAANAKCWRINPNPNAKAQFKTVEEAMNDINVLPGDTLLMDPGSHGGFELKRNNMTIIGTGYYLDQNKNWSESMCSEANYIYLTEGSKVEGMYVKEWIGYKNEVGNITVSRCRAESISINTGIVERCYVTTCINVGKNAIVRNNLVDMSGGYVSSITGKEGSLIENNTITSKVGDSRYTIIDANNSTIRNNIVINTRTGFDNNNNVPYSEQYCIDFDGTKNNVIQNNVFSITSNYAPTNYPNNHFVGASIENTFVMTGSEDGMYQLLETSAAKNAATHGGDCGAFGGATPYVLSGIPQFLPHITEALVSAKPTDGKITVKLKIENQDE